MLLLLANEMSDKTKRRWPSLLLLLLLFARTYCCYYCYCFYCCSCLLINNLKFIYFIHFLQCGAIYERQSLNFRAHK